MIGQRYFCNCLQWLAYSSSLQLRILRLKTFKRKNSTWCRFGSVNDFQHNNGYGLRGSASWSYPKIFYQACIWLFISRWSKTWQWKNCANQFLIDICSSRLHLNISQSKIFECRKNTLYGFWWINKFEHKNGYRIFVRGNGRFPCNLDPSFSHFALVTNIV